MIDRLTIDLSFPISLFFQKPLRSCVDSTLLNTSGPQLSLRSVSFGVAPATKLSDLSQSHLRRDPARLSTWLGRTSIRSIATSNLRDLVQVFLTLHACLWSVHIKWDYH